MKILLTGWEFWMVGYQIIRSFLCVCVCVCVRCVRVLHVRKNYICCDFF
jgi:hypothetical protein